MAWVLPAVKLATAAYGAYGVKRGIDQGKKSGVDVSGASLRTPEQERLLRDLISGFQGNANSGAAFDLRNTSLAGLEQAVLQTQQPGAEDAALQDILTGGSRFDEEAFNTTVQEPLLRDFERTVLPRISRQFGDSGLFSSDRQRVDLDAQEALLRTLTQERTKAVVAGRDQVIQEKLAALGLIPGLQSADRQTLQAGLSPRQQDLVAMLTALGFAPKENIATVTPPPETSGIGELLGSLPTLLKGIKFGGGKTGSPGAFTGNQSSPTNFSQTLFS